MLQRPARLDHVAAIQAHEVKLLLELGPLSLRLLILLQLDVLSAFDGLLVEIDLRPGVHLQLLLPITYILGLDLRIREHNISGRSVILKMIFRRNQAKVEGTGLRRVIGAHSILLDVFLRLRWHFPGPDNHQLILGQEIEIRDSLVFGFVVVGFGRTLDVPRDRVLSCSRFAVLSRGATAFALREDRRSRLIFGRWPEELPLDSLDDPINSFVVSSVQLDGVAVNELGL